MEQMVLGSQRLEDAVRWTTRSGCFDELLHSAAFARTFAAGSNNTTA